MKKFAMPLLLAMVASAAFGQSLFNPEQMKRELTSIANIYRTTYAPIPWKEKQLDWNLDEELAKALAAVDSKTSPTAADYRTIVSDLLRSTQDYHVGCSFFQTEAATLPFMIKSAQGRYFIVNIDRSKLGEDAFPFNVGDEVLKMDQRPIAEVTKELAAQIGGGVEQTDMGLAELTLTRRRASRAVAVPRGPVEFEILKKGAKNSRTVQLMWDYKPEDLIIPITQATRVKATSTNTTSLFKDTFQRARTAKMALPFWEKYGDFETAAAAENLFQIGGKKSYVPTLGKVEWEADANNHYYAYIYTNAAGKKIGYVRIAHYMGEVSEFMQFMELMNKYQSETDALVIDEINNPGGSVFYLYALQSVLTDKSLYTPKHQVRLFPESVKESLKIVEELQKVKNDEEAVAALGSDWGGYPVNYQMAQFVLQYARETVRQWNEGKTLTDPIFLWGADRINPNSQVNYTKPILVLVNEMDFSGGDFFPAILQDNKRATIMGVRTAGAGGFVTEAKIPSLFGLEGFTVTGSIAKRIDGNPIENLGVVPEIAYEITVDDIQGGFAGYKNAINEAVQGLLK